MDTPIVSSEMFYEDVQNQSLLCKADAYLKSVQISLGLEIRQLSQEYTWEY